MTSTATLRRPGADRRTRERSPANHVPAAPRMLALAAGADSELPKRGEAEDAAPDAQAGTEIAGLRVLMVEDEALVALELEDVLAELGAVVVGMALDADEAVRLAGALRPDCVTMDIRLQGDRDGIAAATEIWGLYGIRCVLVSAHGDPKTLARAAPANPIALVPKPISKAQLAAALAAARP